MRAEGGAEIIALRRRSEGVTGRCSSRRGDGDVDIAASGNDVGTQLVRIVVIGTEGGPLRGGLLVVVRSAGRVAVSQLGAALGQIHASLARRSSDGLAGGCLGERIGRAFV